MKNIIKDNSISKIGTEKFCEKEDLTNVLEWKNFDNSNLLSKEEIEDYKNKLFGILEELFQKNNYKKPIIFITDWTFLPFIKSSMEKIFGKTLFDRYLDFLNITFKDYNEIDLDEFDKYFQYNVHNNSLIILWGSVTNVPDINKELRDSYFLKYIKDIAYGTGKENENNCLLGICYWHQLIAKILWHQVKDCIIPDFWTRVCEINDNLPEFYKKIFEWVSNKWENKNFSAGFTRNQEVCLNYENWNKMIPLLKNNYAFGTENERVMSFQFHPELDITEGGSFSIKEKLINSYSIPEEMIDFWEDKISSNIDEAFLVPLFYRFIKKINENFYQKEDNYQKIPSQLFYTNKLTSNKLVGIYNDEFYQIKFPDRRKYFEYLYTNWLLEINSKFDRKVNRWIKEVSGILGVKNIKELIDKKKDFLENIGVLNWVFKLRDLWTWDWTFIEEIDKSFYKKNVVIWWVWDRVYADLYKWLKYSNFYWKIPDEVLQLFVKKFIQKKSEIENKQQVQMKDLIPIILDNLEIGVNDLISDDSMFSESSKMYSCDLGKKLSLYSQTFLESEEWKNQLELLKIALKKDFLKYIKWYFERIFVSDFENFFENLEELVSDDFWEDIKKQHFQLSVKGTSHLNNIKYKNFIQKCLENWTEDGGVILDDGIVQSYTKEVRLEELYCLKNIFEDSLQIFVVTDNMKKEVVSVIIEKFPFQDLSFREENIQKWYRIDIIDNLFFDLEIRLSSEVRKFTTNFMKDLSFQFVDIIKEFDEEIEILIKEALVCVLNNNYQELTYRFQKFIDKVLSYFIKEIRKQKGKNKRYRKTFLSKVQEKYYKKIDDFVKNLYFLQDCKLKLIKEGEELKNDGEEFKKDFEYFDSVKIDPIDKHFWYWNSDRRKIEVLGNNWVDFYSNFPEISFLLKKKQNFLNFKSTSCLNNNFDGFFKSSEEKEKFRNNIKLLIVDERASFKHFLKILLESDFNCNKDNLFFVSEISDILCFSSQIDLVLIDSKMLSKMYENWIDSEKIQKEKGFKLLLFGEEQNEDNHNTFNKKDFLEKMKSIEGLKEKVLSRV